MGARVFFVNMTSEATRAHVRTYIDVCVCACVRVCVCVCVCVCVSSMSVTSKATRARVRTLKDENASSSMMDKYSSVNLKGAFSKFMFPLHDGQHADPTYDNHDR